MPHPCSLNRSRGKKRPRSSRSFSPRRLGRLSSPLSTTITTTTVSPGPPRNSPLSSVANETKIKCKWKFIAPGDRRRFRTFKYFINFLLLSSPSSPSYYSRWTVEPCRWNKWNDFNKQRNQLSFSILCRFFISRELRYIYIVMLLKLVERRWIPLPLFRGYSISIENAEGRAGEERSRSK